MLHDKFFVTSNKNQLNLCIAFIEYQKALDSIEHEDMFDALRKIRIDEGNICILENVHTDDTARIHVDDDVSKEDKIERGLRQGDTLCPLNLYGNFRAGFQGGQPRRGRD